MDVEAVPVRDLLANSIVGRADHLDHAKVERYAAEFDHLPRAVAFRTPAGLLLADGYHRAAAAESLGRQTMLVDVHDGTRRGALLYAVRLGALDKGIPEEDVMRRIMGVSRNDKPLHDRG